MTDTNDKLMMVVSCSNDSPKKWCEPFCLKKLALIVVNLRYFSLWGHLLLICGNIQLDLSDTI